MGRTRPSPSRAEGSVPGLPRPPRAGAAPGRAPRAGAVEAALEALSRRPRTTAEILIWLKRRRYTDQEASSAVERLRELGYLDDSAYAAAFAGTIARSRAWGPRRVKQELARRGIQPEAIEEGLSRAEEEGSPPSENIHRALARLTRGGSPRRTPRDWLRLRAALLRRGYEPESIGAVLAALGEEAPAETGDPS